MPKKDACTTWSTSFDWTRRYRGAYEDLFNHVLAWLLLYILSSLDACVGYFVAIGLLLWESSSLIWWGWWSWTLRFPILVFSLILEFSFIILFLILMFSSHFYWRLLWWRRRIWIFVLLMKVSTKSEGNKGEKRVSQEWSKANKD